MKRFKHQFQKNYEQGSSFYNKDMWEKLESKLDVNDKKKKRFAFLNFSKWAAVFLLLMSFGTAIYFVSTKQINPLISPIAKAETKTHQPKLAQSENTQPTRNQAITQSNIPTKKVDNRIPVIQTSINPEQKSIVKISKNYIEPKSENTLENEAAPIQKQIITPEIPKYVDANSLLVSAEIENYMEDKKNNTIVKSEEETPEKKKKAALEINIMGFDVSRVFKKNQN